MEGVLRVLIAFVISKSKNIQRLLVVTKKCQLRSFGYVSKCVHYSFLPHQLEKDNLGAQGLRE